MNDRPMTTPNTVDVSAEAATELLHFMEGISFRRTHGVEPANVVRAMIAEGDSLRSKLAEAERELDAAACLEKIFAADAVRQGGVLKMATASRDAALSELAKLRAEAEWYQHPPDDLRFALGALRNLHFVRPHALASDEQAKELLRPLKKLGDVRVVYVNEGDWIVVEMAIAALPSPPKDPAHD